MKKYSLILLGFGLSVILFLVIMILGFVGMVTPMAFIPQQFIEDFITIIPWPNLRIPFIGMLIDILILYLLPVLIVLIVIAISPLMIKFFYKIHKLINRRAVYGIMDMKDKKPKFYYLGFRVLVVGLFAFSLMAILIEFGAGVIFREGVSGTGQAWELVFQAEAVFLGTYFIAPFILLIFVPLWIMEDSGLMAYKSFSDQRRTPDIEGVHTTYSHILEAYSGVSTFIVLFTYIWGAISVLLTDPGALAPNFMSIVSIIVLPLTITGLFTLAVVVYEKNIDKVKERIQKAMLDEGFVMIEIPEMEKLKI